MTHELKRLKLLIRLLNQAAKIADELEVCLGNGEEAGGIVGGIASELEVKMHAWLDLTNGEETFCLSQITEDERGPAHGKDSIGSGYTRCDAGACDHSRAPKGAAVWHDDEHTETLWEDAR